MTSTPDRSPEWTQEDSVAYEVARDPITALMAYRSRWIFGEEAKPSPDHAAIEYLRHRSRRASRETASCHGQRQGLSAVNATTLFPPREHGILKLAVCGSSL
jgi:hypothetical protein